MKKLLCLGLLMVILLSSFVNAQDFWSVISPSYGAEMFARTIKNNLDFNYQLLRMTAIGIPLQSTEYQEVEIRTYGMYTVNNQIYAKVTPWKTYYYSNGSSIYNPPNASASLRVYCTSWPNIVSYNLSTQASWMQESFAMFSFALSPGSINQTTLSVNESIRVYTSTRCSFTAFNQKLVVSLYTIDSGVSIGQTCDKFTVPNQAIADLVTKTSGLMAMGFDVAEMSLIIVGVILVIFVPVFLYKLIKYLAKRHER